MKSIITLITSLLLATVALAVVDPGPDCVGLYFDMEAEQYCLDGVTPYQTVPLYLILTNPTFADLYGLECGVRIDGNCMVLSLTLAWPTSPVLPGPDLGNLIVATGAPRPTSEATHLATASLLYLATDLSPVHFYLGGSDPSSIHPDFPSLLLAGGEVIMACKSVADGPAAQINGECQVVASEARTFDSLKSLYR
jgi:hypothetical protein